MTELHNVARALGEFYRWPDHMTVETKTLVEFQGIRRRRGDEDDVNAAECFICEMPLENGEQTALRCYHRDCCMQSHGECLTDHFAATWDLIGDADAAPADQPERGYCPYCQQELQLALLTQQSHGRRAERGDRPTKKARKRRRVGFETSQEDVALRTIADDDSWFQEAMMESDDDEDDVCPTPAVHEDSTSKGHPVQVEIVDLTLEN